MNKKKIIIIAAVAVVLFILWKRGTFDSLLGKSGSNNGSSGTGSNSDSDEEVDFSEIDYDSYESIINHTSMSASLKKTCKAIARSYFITIEDGRTDGSGNSIKALEEKSARNYGITFTQQGVRSSIKQLATVKKLITETEAAKYMDEVLEM